MEIFLDGCDDGKNFIVLCQNLLFFNLCLLPLIFLLCTIAKNLGLSSKKSLWKTASRFPKSFLLKVNKMKFSQPFFIEQLPQLYECISGHLLNLLPFFNSSEGSKTGCNNISAVLKPLHLCWITVRVWGFFHSILQMQFNKKYFQITKFINNQYQSQ